MTHQNFLIFNMNIEIPDLLGFVRRAGSLSPKQNKPQRIASNRIESNQIEKHDNPIDSSANHLKELIYFGGTDNCQHGEET